MQIGEKAPAAQPDLRPGQIVIKDLDGYVRDENGNPKVDQNGRFMLLGHADGTIDEADTQLIGTQDPGWMASMTNTFKYKGFDLNIMFNGMFDRIMQDPTEMDFGLNGGNIAQNGSNMLRIIKDRWTFDNPSTTRPSSYYTSGTKYTAGDFFYQKAWFIRLQNISLGYTLPKSILTKSKILNNVRFHASVNNVFVITPYNGLDLETDAYGSLSQRTYFQFWCRRFILIIKNALMKKICKLLILAAALTGGISLNSCIDLDPVDYSDINPSNFPQTETDIQSMVNSCYYSVRSSWFDGLFSTSERGVTVVNDLTTEILSCKSGFLKDVSELNYFSTTADLTRFYYTDTDAYSDGWLNDISRCTSVLAQIEACNFLSAEKKQYYEAEIRCARGLIAYTLYDMFGPLVIAPIEVLNNPTVEKPLARLSKEEMVKFIEDDLIFAATYLPTPTEAEYGRFSQGLANMLLIRLYLHESPENKEYYTKIEEIARKLMAPSYGYRLSTSYTQMFEIGGQGRGNAEIIWAIPVNTEAVSWNDWHMFVLPTDFADHGMTSGYECVNSTWYFYDSFEVNDVRKTYLVTSYKAQDGSIINRENPGLHLELGPIPLKYGYDINVTGNGGKSNIDPIIYRLADVYLTLAEALYLKPASSETDKEEAISYINTIRNRANLDEINSKDITTEEKFIEILLKERSHELWCENGQYRADLIRFNKFVEHAETVKGTVYASKNKELYPLPLSAINDGKGFVIQNPGY